MSDEAETKKLLKFRQTLEDRIYELETEIQDLRKAVEVIDQQIVSQGFRTLTLPAATVKESKHIPAAEEKSAESTSITAKDGTILGKMYVEGQRVSFKPQEGFNFTIDSPPFKSFLIDRVLSNMKENDEEKAGKGEIDPAEIIEYEVKTVDEEITEIIIENYGGERRLREINSSIRWTFDKMYEKLKEA